jgi:hypothetical protein
LPASERANTALQEGNSISGDKPVLTSPGKLASPPHSD